MAKKVISLFVTNSRLSGAGIQFLVGLTTLIMVLNFLLDGHRHRTIGRMRNFLIMLDVTAYALLHYSLGVMQRPSDTNNYYQVWAVLLVTLRYSVKHGRPAGVALRQTPLVDLMSSFWAAHILRSRAPLTLKIPVWLLWSINSARIIHGFVSSELATAYHKENVRLVTEYMRHPSAGADPATMAGYKYLVLGEAQQRKKVKHPHYRLELQLTEEEKLITVDKIWRWSQDQSPQGRHVSQLLNARDGKLKDLCLSFALYKLLRRRFFNLPIHESNMEETKQLIFQGILNCRSHPTTASPSGASPSAAPAPPAEEEAGQSTPSYERALRVTKAELAFLNDYFFSRHALMFAKGFPFMRLLLSTLLVGAISYMAVAIHRFSKHTKEDELGRVHVHHGVVFTWILLTLLGVKELYEIASYVLSDWTKVLLLCKYVRQPWWLRGSVMSMLVRLLCRYSLVKRWHERIGQYNLLFGRGRRSIIYYTDLSPQVQEKMFRSLSSSRNQPADRQPSDRSYVDRALKLLPRQQFEGVDNLKEAIEEALNEFQGEVCHVHRILLWHIATCYCECHLACTRPIGVKRPRRVRTGPFVKQSELKELGQNKKHYITAVRLSQYCAHLLRLTPALIPGNDIITTAVFKKVIGETVRTLKGCFSVEKIFEKLENITEQPQGDQGSAGADSNSTEGRKVVTRCCGRARAQSAAPPAQEAALLKRGSTLAKKLIEITGENNHEARWAFLAELWAGLLLHLAESTGASKHKIHLSMGGEFITHLWALLSHAGIMGSVAHGEMGNAAVEDVQRQEIVINQ